MNKSKLVENKRWKVDNKEQKSLQKQENNDRSRESYDKSKQRYDKPLQSYDKPRQSYDRSRQSYDRSSLYIKNINIENKEEFPEFCKTIKTTDKVSNEYLEKIKKEKEKNEELNKIKLKPGWIAYKKGKNSNQINISRDGINYYPSLRETYTDEEWEEKEKNEFNKEMKLFSYRVNKLYLKRQQESDDYYYETGKLDTFAIVQRQALEYEEYLKKFDENEEELFEEESEEDDDLVNSDNDEYHKRR